MHRTSSLLVTRRRS